MIPLYSVGHSTHSFGHLLALLRRHQIGVVVDVRSVPYSRRHPEFDLPAMRETAGENDLRYVHMPELGGRPRDRRFYDGDGHVLYSRLAESEAFSHGIERLLLGSERYRVAVLCTEEDPMLCHRWRLISRAVEEAGGSMLHIRGDGHVESHREVLLRDEAAHPEAYQLELLDTATDHWRSTKAVRGR